MAVGAPVERQARYALDRRAGAPGRILTCHLIFLPTCRPDL
jgi:hypothetical protein